MGQHQWFTWVVTTTMAFVLAAVRKMVICDSVLQLNHQVIVLSMSL